MSPEDLVPVFALALLAGQCGPETGCCWPSPPPGSLAASWVWRKRYGTLGQHAFGAQLGSDMIIRPCWLDVRFARKRTRLGDLRVHAQPRSVPNLALIGRLRAPLTNWNYWSTMPI